MGVWGLTSFIERNCKDVFVQVNVQNLIEKYKKENNTNEAVILINMQSFLNFFEKNELNWICGGQMKELLDIAKDFVLKFEKIGAKLVFFDVGEVTTSRRDGIIVEREGKRMEKIASGFDSLKRKEEMKVDTLVTSDNSFISGDFHNISKCIVKEVCLCEVYHTNKEVDEEIANYARTNNSFAILGVDSDFIIYNAAKYYLSARDLNLSTMTTMRYDSEALANYLNIHVKSLPLFASLVGNDFIRRPELEAFHKYVCRKETGRRADRYPKHILMQSVASYVRNFAPGILIKSTLSEIADMVFLDKEKASKIAESIESYLPDPFLPEGDIPTDMDEDPKSLWGKTYIKAWNLRSRYSIFRVVYILMKFHGRKLSVSLEDPRMTDLPLSKTLLRRLRLSVLGVLLLEYPYEEESDDDSSEEELAAGEVLVAVPSPIFPPRDLHPGLLALWDEERTDIADKRWALFAHSVSPNLTGEQLRALPPILVVPAAILFYLRAHIPVVADKDSGYLEEWELKALAIQAVLVETTTLEEISAIRIEPPYNTRAIRLASIFMRAVTQMLILLAACGFPIPMEQAMPWHYFDGKLFHQTYKKILAGEKCEQLAGDKVPLCEQLCELVLQAQAE